MIWAPVPEDNPDVSETQLLLTSLDLRLKDCERISWRNDKRITRAFGNIPIDGEVDKQQVQNQGKEQPAAILTPGEGEPTLTPGQIQEMFNKGVG